MCAGEVLIVLFMMPYEASLGRYLVFFASNMTLGTEVGLRNLLDLGRITTFDMVSSRTMAFLALYSWKGPRANDSLETVLMTLLGIACRMTLTTIVRFLFTGVIVNPLSGLDIPLRRHRVALLIRGNDVSLFVHVSGLPTKTTNDIADVVPRVSLGERDSGMLGLRGRSQFVRVA
jgi:hypothetical protein